MLYSVLNTCIFLFWLLFSGNHLGHKEPEKKVLYRLSGRAQGTTYDIRYIHSSPIIDSIDVHDVLSAIDQSLSLYQPISLISQFNNNIRGVKADSHLLNVVRKSISVSKVSEGCFDITSKPVSMLWGFNSSMPRSIPSRTTIMSTLKLIGSAHLSFQNDSLIKDNPKTMIDCDGIAQGYTVDQLSLFLRNKGITDFMVELGGEVYVSGKNLSDNNWIIGVEQPTFDAADEPFIGKKISLSDMAVTTSGSMKKFRKLGNNYWSHVVDPRSARPVNNGIVSVTVIASDAMTADAFDNAFMVMGVNRAMTLANSFTDMGLYIVYACKDGRLADTSNAFFDKYTISR